jgi:hypothetical protein
VHPRLSTFNFAFPPRGEAFVDASSFSCSLLGSVVEPSDSYASPDSTDIYNYNIIHVYTLFPVPLSFRY